VVKRVTWKSHSIPLETLESFTNTSVIFSCSFETRLGLDRWTECVPLTCYCARWESNTIRAYQTGRIRV